MGSHVYTLHQGCANFLQRVPIFLSDKIRVSSQVVHDYFLFSIFFFTLNIFTIFLKICYYSPAPHEILHYPNGGAPTVCTYLFYTTRLIKLESILFSSYSLRQKLLNNRDVLDFLRSIYIDFKNWNVRGVFFLF